MKTIITVLLALMLLPVTWAAEIAGQIKVMARDGEETLASYEHAIVYLTGIHSKAPTESVISNQKNKQFQPRLLPVVVGQTVDFTNEDPIQHNVFSSDKRKQFDLGRYPSGESKSVTYDKEGHYKVYCDIHRKMISDIVVVPSIYYATTDTEGNYLINNVPDGTYQLKAWHIYGGSEEKTVEVKNKNIVLNMTLVSTKVIRELEAHKNKNGEAYKKKASIDDYGDVFDDDYDPISEKE